MGRFLLLIFSISLSVGAFAQSYIPSSKSENLQIPASGEPSLRISDAGSVSGCNAPRGAAAVDDWIDIGTGYYKDILFSDLFGYNPQTLPVRFQQSASDPSLFRIPDVYENMDFSQYAHNLTYDAANATPMVLHVYNDEYAYFEEFDTGVRINYSSSSDYYNGEVHMLMQGVDLLEQNDIQTLAYYLPECLMQYRKGNFTMSATFNLQNRTWSNILGLVWVTGTPYDKLFKANSKGDFFMSLPEASDYDPDEDWENIGNALFTDVFTEDLVSNAEYSSWEVPMQKNIIYPGRYRLVNPYAGWKGYIPGVVYDTENTYYMELVMQDYDGFSLVGIPTFYTGLTKEGTGGYAVSNQAADVLSEIDDFLTLYYNFNGCLGLLENGVITYSSHCLIDYEMILNFYGYFGAFKYDGTFYSVNSKGNFRIVMPSSEENAVEEVLGEDDGKVEYYNLQGIRVSEPSKGEMLIMRQKGKSNLIIY